MSGLSSLFIFTVGILCFVVFNFHFLMMLISLEVISLSLLIGCINWVSFGHSYIFFVMIVSIVCVGGYGISMLVSYARLLGISVFFV